MACCTDGSPRLHYLLFHNENDDDDRLRLATTSFISFRSNFITHIFYAFKTKMMPLLPWVHYILYSFFFLPSPSKNAITIDQFECRQWKNVKRSCLSCALGRRQHETLASVNTMPMEIFFFFHKWTAKERWQWQQWRPNKKKEEKEQSHE